MQKNYRVNDDGSVTFTGGNDDHADTIADIFRVEFANGGIFAGLRMYNRAVKYAKNAGIANSRLLVEKLMLGEYPNCFKTVKPARRMKWYIIASVFFVILTIFGLILVGDHNTEGWWFLLPSAFLTGLFVKLALMERAKIRNMLTKAVEMRQKIWEKL